jgi:bifunctional DNA-binding transcriptional regulator/antitoxin component of YhaV-PrlF toxin-antitoxin module
MPRLVKGGKFIYGISRVSPQGSIVIPCEAMQEYGFDTGDEIITISGSRRSGGFGLTKRNIIEKSVLAGIIDAMPSLFNNTRAGSQISVYRGRVFWHTTIKNGGYIVMPSDVLTRYGIEAEDLLAVGCGSRFAIAFIAKGPIMDECLQHPELQFFPSE